MRNGTLWRRAGESANDRYSQSFDGFERWGHALEWEGWHQVQECGKAWVGCGEQGGLLLQGWYKCELEPIEAYFSVTVWQYQGMRHRGARGHDPRQATQYGGRRGHWAKRSYGSRKFTTKQLTVSSRGMLLCVWSGLTWCSKQDSTF